MRGLIPRQVQTSCQSLGTDASQMAQCAFISDVGILQSGDVVSVGFEPMTSCFDANLSKNYSYNYRS